MKNNDLVIEIGDNKIYTNMFKLGDIEKLFLLKTEMDYAIKEKDEDRAYKLYKDYLDKLYSDVDENFREYAMVYNIVASEAKSKYKLHYVCEHCKTENHSLMEIGLNYKLYEHDLIDGFKMRFNYANPKDSDVTSIYENIHSISIRGNIIPWELLSDDSKEILFSYISHDDYDDIFKSIQMCRATIHGQGSMCCEKSTYPKGKFDVYGGYRIFGILINSSNLPILYKTNHELLSRGISLTDQMLMKPFERSIYVSMIIQKEKEESEKYAKDGVS